MFVDVAKIKIKAGKGGDGKVAFHREKYIAAGGPDGGDGGKGGDVIFVEDPHLSTLLDFRFKKKYVAPDGEPGGTKKCFGKDGENIYIKVPVGTLIKEASSGSILCDMSRGVPFTAARGGRGGWGNAHFATPTRQAPRFAKPGQPGDEADIILELKLIADVGLIGFPNVGKSTLLSVISAARPKIANYHFTTLSPNLGVVYVGEGASFVAADIPGIIEGAAQGAGLGFDFLRHIERCRMLVHVIDVSGSEGRDPADDLIKINSELSTYSKTLAERPQIIAANKCDVLESGSDNLARLKEKADSLGYKVIEISAASNKNVDKLVSEIWKMLEALPPVTVYEAEKELSLITDIPTEREIIITKENGIYFVSGAWIEKIVGSINFDDYESRMYFDRVMRKAGVFDMLEREGIQEKDTVDVLGMQFEYVF